MDVRYPIFEQPAHAVIVSTNPKQRFQVFSRLAKLPVFPRLAPGACFPRLAPGACFTALDTACMFFPALQGTDCMFSRASGRRLHVFLRLASVSCRAGKGWAMKRAVRSSSDV